MTATPATTVPVNDHLILASGDFDIAIPASMLSSGRIPRAAQSVTLDLSSVAFIDASGLGAVVTLRNEVLASGRTFHLTGVNAGQRRVFLNGGLRSIL